MNIVFIFSHLGKTGTNIQHYYLLKGLIENSKNVPVKIEIVTFKYKEENFFDEFCRDSDILVHRFGAEYNSFLYSYLCALLKFRSFRPDRVVSYGLLADLISITNHSAMRFAFVHSTFRLNYNYRYGRTIGSVITFLHKRILSSMTDLLSISESVRHGLLIEGMSSSLVRNSFVNDRNIASGLFVNPNLTFATISSGIPGKNIRFLCDYFKGMPHMQLLVYGEFKYENEFRYPNIHFKGYSNDLLSELSRVKYFISASLHEGLPNAVIEALFSGCVAILSSIPAHIEISHLVQGKNCFIFNLDKEFQDLNRVMVDLVEYDAEPSHMMQSLIRENLNSKITVQQFLKAITYV